MAREDHQFKVRLDSELKARIEASAKHAGRSMNAEIVLRLEISCRLHPDLDGGPDEPTADLPFNERRGLANGMRLVSLAMTEVMDGRGGMFVVSWRPDDAGDQDEVGPTLTYKVPAAQPR